MRKQGPRFRRTKWPKRGKEAKCAANAAESGIFPRTHKPLKRILLLIVLPLLILFICGIVIISANMTPAMETMAATRIHAVTARAMNDAILASMDEQRISIANGTISGKGPSVHVTFTPPPAVYKVNSKTNL